jgi:polysaccharide biosynthesis protein PslG
VGISIWYDWKDDGANPTDAEHHFGSVYRDLKPKPATKAAQTLSTTLKGYHFVRRLPGKDDRDYLLLLAADGKQAIAAWTTGDAHAFELALPVANVKEVKVVGMLGEQSVGKPVGAGLSVELSRSPQYVLFGGD